jgi:hypothetical protein
MVSLTKVTPKPINQGSRFEILGVFGSGKTTLARHFTRKGGYGLFEDHEANPFWGKAAELDVAGYLPYDLGFLVGHAFLCADYSVNRSDTFGVSDWSFETDRLWASLRLGESAEEYAAVWRDVARQAGAAAGYVLLDVPPALIVERMRFRGRAPEADLYPFIESAAASVSSAAAGLPAEKLLILDGTRPLDSLAEEFEHWARYRMTGTLEHYQ